MPEMPLVQITVTVEAITLQLALPDPAWVEERFRRERASGRAPEKPYWSRIWASAYALSSWLVKHKELVAGKKVLELAAGIGLPSLVIAPYAKSVVGSDYLPDAVALLQRNVADLGLANYDVLQLDWNNLPDDLTSEILLLSDVNYAPADFPKLLAVLQRFLRQGTTVLLATPQRITGAAFIDTLAHWILEKEEVGVDGVSISIYRLEKVG